MSFQSNQNTNTEPSRDRFQAEFEALPLDKKFASLFRMEAATLTEAFEYVFNSPMQVVDKVGDVLSDFATKVETEFKKASQRSGGAQAQTPSEPIAPPTDSPGPKRPKRKSADTPDA